LGRYFIITVICIYYSVNYKYLIIYTSEDAVYIDYSTEVAQQVQVCLENVPSVITINNIKYELRGICSHKHGMSRLRHIIGHYQSYCKRNHTNIWELYDDMKSKPIPVKASTRVPCEFLIYTI